MALPNFIVAFPKISEVTLYMDGFEFRNAIVGGFVPMSCDKIR